MRLSAKDKAKYKHFKLKKSTTKKTSPKKKSKVLKLNKPVPHTSKKKSTVKRKSTSTTKKPVKKLNKPVKTKSFKSAFAEARGAGKKVFTWRGKRYTTKVK